MTHPADVPIRDAATVILLRDGATGIEAWLLTRVNKMTFAPGATVYPGGRVDDADVDLPWSGRPAETFADAFGCPVDLARALVGAAVRETFEETGVLLTDPRADLADQQGAVEAGTIGFGALLAEHRLAIDADLVRPWARWITPPGESRRYDTHFFVAALPDGARAADVSTESQVAAWIPVAEALRRQRAGELLMLPPTIVTLTSLADLATVADVLDAAAARDLDPVEPTIVVTDGRITAVLDDGTSIRIR